VILTDIKMPGIFGDQILDYLRNKIKKSTPNIGMSGTPWLLAESQFDAVLSKRMACLYSRYLQSRIIVEPSDLSQVFEVDDIFILWLAISGTWQEGSPAG